MRKGLSVKEGRKLLKKQSKPNKYGSIKIVVCPHCWTQLGNLEWRREHINRSMVCAVCKNQFQIKDSLIFDSRAEWARGWELKLLRKVYKIRHLTHHEKILICKDLYCRNDELNFLVEQGHDHIDLYTKG